MRKIENFHLRVTLPATVVVVVLAGVWLSVTTRDPHWANRSGALVSAIAASAILQQIKAERHLEHENARLAAKMPNLRTNPEVATPVDDLEVRLTINRLELQRARLARTRLVVAAFVVGCAIIGELLHGFGDLGICYSLRVCEPETEPRERRTPMARPNSHPFLNRLPRPRPASSGGIPVSEGKASHQKR